MAATAPSLSAIFDRLSKGKPAAQPLEAENGRAGEDTNAPPTSALDLYAATYGGARRAVEDSSASQEPRAVQRVERTDREGHSVASASGSVTSHASAPLLAGLANAAAAHEHAPRAEGVPGSAPGGSEAQGRPGPEREPEPAADGGGAAAPEREEQRPPPLPFDLAFPMGTVPAAAPAGLPLELAEAVKRNAVLLRLHPEYTAKSTQFVPSLSSLASPGYLRLQQDLGYMAMKRVVEMAPAMIYHLSAEVEHLRALLSLPAGHPKRAQQPFPSAVVQQSFYQVAVSQPYPPFLPVPPPPQHPSAVQDAHPALRQALMAGEARLVCSACRRALPAQDGAIAAPAALPRARKRRRRRGGEDEEEEGGGESGEEGAAPAETCGCACAEAHSLAPPRFRRIAPLLPTPS